MTITLTPLSKNQWVKVGFLVLWLAASFGLAALTAWIAKDRNWLATMPGYNFIIYGLSQVFQDEASTEESELPSSVAGLAEQVALQVPLPSPPSSLPTPATLTTAPLGLVSDKTDTTAQ